MKVNFIVKLVLMIIFIGLIVSFSFRYLYYNLTINFALVLCSDRIPDLGKIKYLSACRGKFLFIQK